MYVHEPLTGHAPSSTDPDVVIERKRKGNLGVLDVLGVDGVDCREVDVVNGLNKRKV